MSETMSMPLTVVAMWLIAELMFYCYQQYRRRNAERIKARISAPPPAHPREKTLRRITALIKSGSPLKRDVATFLSGYESLHARPVVEAQYHRSRTVWANDAGSDSGSEPLPHPQTDSVFRWFYGAKAADIYRDNIKDSQCIALSTSSLFSSPLSRSF